MSGMSSLPLHTPQTNMSIQPLPPDVIAQIKSATTIISLKGVICELIKNSLDATCTKLDISVDYARGNCVVEDNGLGIPPAEFREGGGLGKLHRETTRKDCILIRD
jgi:DNA mismatch repair protein MLH3